MLARSARMLRRLRMVPRVYFCSNAKMNVKGFEGSTEAEAISQKPVGSNEAEAKEELQCKGCGHRLQAKDPFSDGYIDPEYLDRQLEETKVARANLEPELLLQIEKYLRHYKFEKTSKLPKKDVKAQPVPLEEALEQDLDSNYLDQQFFSKFWRKKTVKGLNCLRCVKLKQNLISDIKADDTQIKKVSRSEVLAYLFKRINRKALVLFVLDINDLSGSWIPEMAEEINRREIPYLVIVNKIDTVPREADESRVKTNIIENLRELQPQLHNFRPDKVLLVSAKESAGFGKVASVLKHKADQLKDQNEKRQMFVVGAVNSGKSSFLNALWNHMKHKEKFSNQPGALQGPLSSRLYHHAPRNPRKRSS